MPLSDINNDSLAGASVWRRRHGVGELCSSVASSMVLLACHTSTRRVWMDGLGLKTWPTWQKLMTVLLSLFGGIIEVPPLPTLQGSLGESHVQIPRRTMAALPTLHPSLRCRFGGLVHWLPLGITLATPPKDV